MKYEIYQLNHDYDTANLLFADYELTIKIAGKVDRQNYKHVFSGTISPSKDPEDVLEHIYTILNIDRPTDFRGHSLSVSDVIVLEGTAYFVDSFGFKEIGEW